MRNARLIANAGSGKTYALTTRMIQLLAQNVEPRKIAALTFTRKSAGEFLSAVFERLASAALDSKKLAELKSHDYLENLDADQCRFLLGKLASQLGCLGMGTIDSLFARIARAFPLESGLADDFTMAGVAEIDAARERTLAELFSNESAVSLTAFIDLLRRINRKHGERDVFKTLLRETQNLHGKYLSTPPIVTWGDSSSIWGREGCVILKAGAIAPAADAFIQAVLDTHEVFSEEAQRVLQIHLDRLRTLEHGGCWNKEVATFVKDRLCKENERGVLQITRKKEGWLTLNDRVRSARTELLHAVLKPEFESLLLRSRSLHALMQKFEATYSSLVRSAGLVTFSDITDSLALKAGDEVWRTSVGYRMDQKFDHWLLDEFQDTSRPQWAILKTFIDEVLMDPEANRTFFYVGDTKQAIYSWRGGDPDLFFEIFDHYNENQTTIHDAPPLVESWRSCPQVIDFVNKVFGDLSSVKDDLEIPDITLQKWTKAWSHHLVSSSTQKIDGFAEWVSVKKNEGDDEEEGDALDRKVLEILNQSTPWERGISCAVLKRDNKGVNTLAALLQSSNIPVAVEGKTNPCVDNPLGAALLATLRMVASPEDALSRTVALGFPAVATWCSGDVWTFRNNTLSSLAQMGFSPTLRGWIESASLDDEPFLKERAAAFLLAAEEFDTRRKSSDGIGDFIRFLENRQTQETEAAGVVRIMTVHQSKGLGFDMVIVSGLDQKGRNNDGTQLALGPFPKDVKWGMLLPPKDIAEQDEVLCNQVELNQADKKYAEICTAYVSLTRAKKALYVVTTELGEKTSAKNFARLLMFQFRDSPIRLGNPNWFEKLTPTPNTADVPSGSVVFHSPIRGTPKAVSPSSFKSQIPTRYTPESPSIDAAELGIEVHNALASIDWIDSATSDWSDLSETAAKLVRDFMAKPIALELFTRPSGSTDVWRERAFDVMLDGHWVSGVFDRVVVHCSDDGIPLSAIIYDFKTDHGSAAEIEERYAGQMEVYRKAVCRLLSLSPDCVKSQILCVR